MVLDLIESSRIEFKVKMVDNLEETIIAFLNSKDGGIIYLGVNDDGEIVGLNNNLDFASYMVENGYAWAYTRYSKDYVSEHNKARASKFGLWADPNPIEPQDFRRASRKK